MTTETDKLVEMAKSGRAGAFYSAAARGWLTFRPDMLADFRAAIIADLAADVEPVAIYHGRCVIDCGEHGHLDMQLLKMIPAGTALCTASTVAALKAERDALREKLWAQDVRCGKLETEKGALKALVAVLEESASQFAGVDLDGMVEAFHRIIESQAQQSPFHNPVNADAALALRELRRLIPAIKAVALTKGQLAPQPQQEQPK